MPINTEEAFDTTSDVVDLMKEIFSKSNVVLFLWFLAIYLVISFVVSTLSKDGSVSSMGLIRIMDLVAICGVGAVLFYGFFNKSQSDKEAYVQGLYDSVLKTIDNPISIFSIGVFIFVFYFALYLLQIQMDTSSKPMSIMIIETGAWILMAATLIVTCFKYVLKVSLVNSLNDMTKKIGGTPVAIAESKKSAPTSILVTPSVSPAPAKAAVSLAPASGNTKIPSTSQAFSNYSEEFTTINGNVPIPSTISVLPPALSPTPSSMIIVTPNPNMNGNSNISKGAPVMGNLSTGGSTSKKEGFKLNIEYGNKGNTNIKDIILPNSAASLFGLTATNNTTKSPAPKGKDKLAPAKHKQVSGPAPAPKRRLAPAPAPALAPAPAPAKQRKQKPKPRPDEVFNIPGDAFTYDDAQSVCKAYNSRLATYDEIEKTYNKGGEWCNYGWSADQYVYMPTQISTWMSTEPKDKCGRPGINGGKVEDPNEMFGVNCYGKKPLPKKKDLQQMEMNKISPAMPLSPEEELFNMKVQFWKNNQDKLLVVNSFNKNKWSNY